jgi:ribose/xylose/arabinose/galactoside ABC-type transport system permease subunit
VRHRAERGVTGAPGTLAGQLPDGSPPGNEDILDAAIAQELEAEPTRVATGWRRVIYGVLSNRSLTITIAGLLVFAFFSLTARQFLTANNLLNLIRNMSLIGIVAVGMTYLLVAGEIDLSVGSVYGVLTVIVGLLVSTIHLDPWLATLSVIGLGTLIGTLNGTLVTRLGIPSFIVTLAALTAYRSAALIVSGQKPSVTQGEGVFYTLTGGSIGPVPWLIVWLAVVGIIGGIILSTSKFGYHVYATGGNLEAARNSGIDTARVKVICFAVTGGLCGLVAGLLWGYLHTAAPVTGTGFEFRVIGAVIIGGVLLSGGRGTIYGSLVGAMIIGMITSGLVLLGLSQDIGDVATGVLIVAVGAFDLIARRTAARGLVLIGGSRE